MPIVLSTDVPADDELRDSWYCGLDTCVTAEVYERIRGHNSSEPIYAFERAMQGPALDMMLKGFLVDGPWRAKQITEYQTRLEFLQERLDRLAHAIWGKPLNPRSPKQMLEFFYSIEGMNLPEVWSNKKGERKLSADREALEKLHDYYLAQPFVNHILALRDASKKLGTLRAGVDPDGRLRCTYNVCGTETGRWSSSQNVYGRGTNLQNLTDELRRMLVADPGYVFVYLDGEQAESRSCGFIQGVRFGLWHYLDVCESGDLHTYVTKIVWKDRPWTGEAKADKALAEEPFYRHFSFRDMAKRGGHGTNYYGTAPTMARHLKVPVPLITEFQREYKSEFPGFGKWWTDVSRQLTTTQSITTFLGRQREFFARPDDASTLRQAIAYEPQSTVGDLVNEGGLRVWRKFPEAQVLAQIHDAYVFQIPEGRVDELVPAMMSTFEVPVTSPDGSRTMVIPAEAKIGWNFASQDPRKKTFSDGNPDGLGKWKGHFDRKRAERPNPPLLDRVLY